MPHARPWIDSLPAYVPGRSIDEVAERYGITDIVKLASNESPEGPFPEVVEVVAKSLAGVNRYPDMSVPLATIRAGERHGVGPDRVWFGAGSSELLRTIALAAGGPGTSSVFAWPSFVVYPIATQLAGGTGRRVPLTSDHRHDLAALRAAIGRDTTVVYVCNPNNPTGTVVDGDELESFVESVPDRVLVVVDEAYAEYATDPSFRSMIPATGRQANLVVTRTFSKVYALAGLRIGYAIGHRDTLASLRKGQGPFTVTAPAQAAAVEALRYPERVTARVARNRAGLEAMEEGLRGRGIPYVPSQANFVLAGPFEDQETRVERLLRHGVIVRPFPGGWVRISVGLEQEIDRLFAALDER